MKAKRLMKTVSLFMVSMVPAVLANVPKSTSISDDTAVYNNIQEIRVKKEKSLDFDSDIERLSAQEKSHRRALPLRVAAPMDRVMKTSYQPSKSLSERVSGIKKDSKSRRQ